MNLPIPTHSSQEILDSTKIQCYQDCPRKFFYEYMLGWRSSYPSNHLHFGKCVHLALEHIILHGATGQAILDAIEIFNSEYRFLFPEATDPIYSPKTPSRFFDCLLMYLKQWEDDKYQYEVYKTEFGGTVSLGANYKLAFKMDTILLDKQTGLYCSLEHKTAGGNYINANYDIQHEMGIQCGTYTHVLNCLFPPEQVSGIIINLLQFKKTKDSTYKPTDFLLQRFPISLGNARMYDWLTTVQKWIDRINFDKMTLSQQSDSDDLLEAFPKNGRSCTNYNKACTYLDLCRGWQNPLQHLDRIPADMKVEFWNPLDEPLREIMEI